MADQLVLLFTDEELRDQARENLALRIGYEYKLEFDPKTSCTNNYHEIAILPYISGRILTRQYAGVSVHN